MRSIQQHSSIFPSQLLCYCCIHFLSKYSWSSLLWRLHFYKSTWYNVFATLKSTFSTCDLWTCMHAHSSETWITRHTLSRWGWAQAALLSYQLLRCEQVFFFAVYLVTGFPHSYMFCWWFCSLKWPQNIVQKCSSVFQSAKSFDGPYRKNIGAR